ncbi:MAG: MFS transporter [Chloroflexi bacterium]|nr:MFS transporter [Chloroflexota bacterium]
MIESAATAPEIRARLPFLRVLPYRWLALATTATTAFLGPLETNLVIISLPTLRREFDVPAASVVWVMVAATLVTLGLTLPVGSLSERWGRRRLFTIGFWLFIAGAVGAFRAPSLPLLVGARALQGLGTALFASTRNAIAVETLPPSRRGLAMGVIIASVGLGGTTAPFLGGWLVDTFGWRAIFAAEVPVALLGAMAALAVLPLEGPTERQRRAFDLPGALFIFGALGGLLVAGNRLPALGVASPLVLGLGSGGLALLLLFLWRERRARNPVLDLSLFRIRGFVAPTVAFVFQMLAFATAANLLPFFLEEAKGLSPAQAGAAFALAPFSLFFGSVLGGLLSDRLGVWRIAVPALGCMALAFASLAILSEGSPLIWVLIPLGVIGLTEGSFQPAAMAAQVGAVPARRLGAVSAIFIAIIMLSLSAGLTLGGTLLSARLDVYEAALGPGPAAVAAAYRDVARVGTVFVVTAFVIMLVFGRPGQRKME